MYGDVGTGGPHQFLADTFKLQTQLQSGGRLHLQDRLVPTKICDIPTTLYWVTTTPMHPARKYCVKCLLLEEEHIGNYFTTTLLSRSK